MSGYSKPTYTQLPNALLDQHLPEMKEAELKVVLVIARSTLGWHKQKDKLSISQLMEKTGLTRQGVVNGIQNGMERGVIERETDGMGFVYFLAINDELVNEVDYLPPELVNEVDQSTQQTSQRSRPKLVNVVDQKGPKLVNVVDTQKKVFKERKENDDDDHASHSKPSPQPGNESRRRQPENATSQPPTEKAEQPKPAPAPAKEKAVNFSDARGQREPADPEYTRVKASLQTNRFGYMAGDTERIFKELWGKYDHGWFDLAIEACLKAGKPTLAYLEGILRRWVTEGKGGYKANGGKPPAAPLQLLTLKRWCLDRYNTDNPKFVQNVPEGMIREQYEQYRKQYYQQQQAH